MPKKMRKCRDCGKSGVYISRKGLCVDCSTKRSKKTALSIIRKKGEAYEAWKAGVKRFIDEEGI